MTAEDRMWNEIFADQALKLELAHAFLFELRDPEGAAILIDQVTEEGSRSQREAAESLRSQIATLNRWA
jgi:FimV-like protein